MALLFDCRLTRLRIHVPLTCPSAPVKSNVRNPVFKWILLTSFLASENAINQVPLDYEVFISNRSVMARNDHGQAGVQPGVVKTKESVTFSINDASLTIFRQGSDGLNVLLQGKAIHRTQVY